MVDLLKNPLMGKVEGHGESWHGHVTAFTVSPKKLMNLYWKISVIRDVRPILEYDILCIKFSLILVFNQKVIIYTCGTLYVDSFKGRNLDLLTIVLSIVVSLVCLMIIYFWLWISVIRPILWIFLAYEKEGFLKRRQQVVDPNSFTLKAKYTHKSSLEFENLGS